MLNLSNNDSLLDLLSDLEYPEIGDNAADMTRPKRRKTVIAADPSSGDTTSSVDFSVVPLLNEVAEKRWTGQSSFAGSSAKVMIAGVLPDPGLMHIVFATFMEWRI